MNEKNYKVFISYASQDIKLAENIVSELIKNGINVVHDQYHFGSNNLIADYQNLLSASDYVVLLLSTNYSTWQGYDLLKHYENKLSKRDITLLPVITDKDKIPEFLKSYQYIDFSNGSNEGIDTLISQIKNTGSLNFSNITHRQFEDMVSELLSQVGFINIRRNTVIDGNEIDVIADYPYTDPFGVNELETWIVETKFYKNSRVDIKTIQKLKLQLQKTDRLAKGLLITNGHITSAASQYINETMKLDKVYIKIIEGTELKRLLLKNHNLLEKYFLKRGN